MTARERTGPLDGLRVIDCSGMIAGGFATTQLADFGADVVFVEHPEYRDPLREWTPFDEGMSLWWKSIGRNKRCISLDLSTDEGTVLLEELVANADLFFENFRPGTMERWGIGPAALQAVNPELIYVRISGYGQTGPKSEQPGYGTVAEGLSGWAHANGFPDREPLLPPISLADLTAAMFAVQASLFAVFERDLGRGGSGTGQVIDVSLYEPLFRLFLSDVEAYDRLGRVRQRIGNRHANASPRGVYETADGFLTLSASSQSIFENVAHAIDRPGLIDDPRFETNGDRVENAEALDEIIEAWTSQRPTQEAIEVMSAADAIVGPVFNMADIFDDEQYTARNDVIEVQDADLGPVATMNVVPRFSDTPGTVEFLGPTHGEHNEEVYLEELDLDRQDYDRLRQQDVI